MPPTTAQRTAAQAFMSITGAQEKVALRILKNNQWKLDQACDVYFGQNPAVPSSTAKERDNLAQLFEKYRSKNDEDGVMSVEGIFLWLNEVEVNMENAEMMVALDIVKAPHLGEIEKVGFVDGWTAIGADTPAKQKTWIKDQVASLSKDQALFKRVYRHAFICCKEKGQKALDLENAIVYWQLLFSPPGMTWVTGETNWLDLWIEFLQAKWTKTVNKDMWNMTYEFYVKSLQDESLDFWSEDGAWPGVIDDFVAWVEEKRHDSLEMMATD